MRFSTTLALPVAREPLFAFHTDPQNLSVLLHGWRASRVLSTAGHIRPGARTEVLERWGPLAFRLVFEHFLFEPPERFGERMVRGPFRLFEHVHRFRDEDGRTVIEDEVELALPPWLGGDLALRLFVLPHLRRFFAFRQRAYVRLAAEGRFGPALGGAGVTARTILVLGGSGIFGGRVAKALAETPGLSVVIAGRNAAAGSAAAARIGAGYVACDLGREGALRVALAEVRPALLIHAAGPFQGAGYDVALSCIEAGVHYLDLADGRAFVSGIGALDAAARARGVAVGSGASSVPTITHALATELAAGFERIDALQIALSPGNQNPRGASTIAAILGSLGKTQAVWTDGRWRAEPYWGDRRRLAFPPSVGERDVYACDVPDLELFPQAFGARTVRFHAGLELGVLNSALSGLRALRAAHLLPPLAPLAPLALRVSLTLYSRGSKNGALAVWARGAPKGAPAETGLVERGLALVTDDDGPATPSSPAILLARKLLLGGGLPAGAYPCMGLLELDEILAHLEPLGIACLCDGGDGRWSARSAR